MSKEYVKELERKIKDTYTPDRYYKLFLYWWAMFGRGFVAAENIFDNFGIPDDFYDYEVDALANDFYASCIGEKDESI